jgi:hypothetical protein
MGEHVHLPLHPPGGFLPSTRYTARVTGDLTDTVGALLGKDYEWEFSTPAHRLLFAARGRRERRHGCAGVVDVQPADAARGGGGRVHAHRQRGARRRIFAWSGGEYPRRRKPSFSRLPILPALGDGDGDAGLAPARYGDLGVAQGTWRFFTIGQPGLTGVYVQEFADDLESANGFLIDFASPMSKTTVAEHLHIASPVIPTGTLEGVNLSWANSDTRLSVNLIKSPGVSYELVLDPGALDREGGLVDAGGSAHFTTTDREPYVLLNTDATLGMYNAYSDTVVYAGYRNVSRLDLTLYQIPPETFIRQTDELLNATVARQWSIPVDPCGTKATLRRSRS